jgi:hypothetical protein
LTLTFFWGWQRAKPLKGGHFVASLVDASGITRHVWPLPMPFLSTDAVHFRTMASRITTMPRQGTFAASSNASAVSVLGRGDERLWDSLGQCLPDEHGCLRLRFSAAEVCGADWLLVSRDLRKMAGSGARLVIEIRHARKVAETWDTALKYWYFLF